MRTVAPIVLVALVAPSAVLAQPRGSRREFDRLVHSAVDAYDAGRYDEAIAALERAYAIRPLPRVLYNLGRAHDQAGRFSTAADYYRRFLGTAPDTAAAAVAREALQTAERRANEQRTAEAQRQAEAEAQRQAETVARQRAELEAQRQAEAEHRRRILSAGFAPRRVTVPVAVLWGIAGAGAITGAVLGGLALSAQSDFDASRQGNDRATAYDTGTATALGADIALGTAIVAGVTGLVLFLVQPRHRLPVSDGAPP